MDVSELRNLYNRARLDDRQVSEIVGLAHGLIADGEVNQGEAEYLYKWLAANKDATQHPLIGILFERVGTYLADGILDEDESADLLDTLKQLAGGEFELGEALKSSSLPLCSPAPNLQFLNRRFCFTGTFAFGKRRDCEKAVKDMGASVGSFSGKTNFLVVGIYATDSWAQSSFGRKIEKAVEARSAGQDLAIVSEDHWLACLRNAGAEI